VRLRCVADAGQKPVSRALGPRRLTPRMPPGLPLVSVILEVNTMDLTTLITACALTVDPKIMHALIWHQSGGEPWAFSVSDQRQPRVLRNMEDTIGAARAIQPGNIAIRVGLAGVPGTPRAVTATTFTPCSNIASAARQIAQFAELCRTSNRSKGDPIHCAIAAYHGSCERPDYGFADAVRTIVAKDDAPDFEMLAGTGIDTADIGSSRQSAPRDAAPAPPPPPTPDDDERAPARALSFRSCHYPTVAERASGKRRTCCQRAKVRRSDGPSDGHSPRTPTACSCRGQRTHPGRNRNDGASSWFGMNRKFANHRLRQPNSPMTDSASIPSAQGPATRA
jgi:hypothetical protein